MTEGLEKTWAILQAKVMLKNLTRESLDKRIVKTREAMLLAQKRTDELRDLLKALSLVTDDEIEENRVILGEKISSLIAELDEDDSDLAELAKIDVEEKKQ